MILTSSHPHGICRNCNASTEYPARH